MFIKVTFKVAFIVVGVVGVAVSFRIIVKCPVLELNGVGRRRGNGKFLDAV
jgi:hypothetical protein